MKRQFFFRNNDAKTGGGGGSKSKAAETKPGSDLPPTPGPDAGNQSAAKSTTGNAPPEGDKEKLKEEPAAG